MVGVFVIRNAVAGELFLWRQFDVNFVSTGNSRVEGTREKAVWRISENVAVAHGETDRLDDALDVLFAVRSEDSSAGSFGESLHILWAATPGRADVVVVFRTQGQVGKILNAGEFPERPRWHRLLRIAGTLRRARDRRK